MKWIKGMALALTAAMATGIASGCTVTVTEPSASLASETQTVQQPPLEEAAADLITFTSRSCVEGFAAAQKRDRFEGCRALCIGQQTAARARECGFDVIVSDEASIESMLEKVKQTGGK